MSPRLCGRARAAGGWTSLTWWLRLPADALRELGRLYRCVMVVATQQYLTSLRNLTKWYEMQNNGRGGQVHRGTRYVRYTPRGDRSDVPLYTVTLETVEVQHLSSPILQRRAQRSTPLRGCTLAYPWHALAAVLHAVRAKMHCCVTRRCSISWLGMMLIWLATQQVCRSTLRRLISSCPERQQA